MRSNNAVRQSPVFTHEGGKATPANPWLELRRSVLACFLFEDTFYEKGSDHAQRVADLVKQVPPEKVAALAVEARDQMHLRHLPLFLVRELARVRGNGALVADTLPRVIQRADELCEYLAIYYRDVAPNAPDAPPLSAGSKRGLERALRKFDEYRLAKYDRDGRFKLRDVLRLVHPRPLSPEQAALWGRVIKRELATPDTWEVALSGGGAEQDKKATWERLLTEGKLGGLALLRNLRNLQTAGVDRELLKHAIVEANYRHVLPFRFVTAAGYAPELEGELEQAMLKALLVRDDMRDGFPTKVPEVTLGGRTLLLLDVSGSMNSVLSNKSETTRLDAACGLAIYLREACPEIAVLTFSERVVQVPSRRGFALCDAVRQSQSHSVTYLAQALALLKRTQAVTIDRIIVVTDEQSHDGGIPAWIPKSYVINVGTYKNGVSHGNGWTHIDGWSERIVQYIAEYERLGDAEE